jgi:beta-lactamase regulating signal transducer with metallopeptidase domain
MERAMLEYLANALWQLPVLAAGAWILLRLVKPSPTTQYRVWLAVLGLAMVLPACGIGSDAGWLPGAGFDETAATQLVYRSAAVVEVEPMAPVEVQPSAENGRETSWLSSRMHRISLSSRTMNWISGVYTGSILLGVLRVMRAWRGARRLVMASREVILCSAAEAVLKDFGRDLNTRLPEVRECAEVTSPMVVGAISPVVLLPKDFAGHGEDEVKAALLHELAHVKRRDYMMNGICQVAALPVGWHPATYAIQQRIRQTREMVCDEMAAREMSSEIGYARCLLTMARRMLGGGLQEGPEFVGLFSNNILEERVMQLMQTKLVVSARAKAIRLASGAGAMAVATIMAASFHVVPTMAAERQVATAPAVPTVEAFSPVAISEARLTEVRPIVAVAPAVVIARTTPAAVPVASTAATSLDELQEGAPIAPIAPVTPIAPVAPQSVPTPAAAPAAPAAPTPAAAPAAPAKNAICKKKMGMLYQVGPGGEGVVIVDGEIREITPEEQERINKAMAASAEGMKEGAKALNSAEFKASMDEMPQLFAKIKVKDLDSNAFRDEMAAVQQALETQHQMMNSEEFQARMAALQAKLQSLKIWSCDAGSPEQEEKQKDKGPQKQQKQ